MEAAPRFRVVDAGTLYITNERFAVQGQQWTDLWFQNIRTAQYDDESIVLYVANAPAVQLRMPYAGYHYVLYRWLAYGEVSAPPGLPGAGTQIEGEPRPGTAAGGDSGWAPIGP